MKTKYIIALTLVSLACKSYAYGPEGHTLVGAIADQMLAGTPTVAKVQALIGSVNLATAATMADELKSYDKGKPKFGQAFGGTSNKKLNQELDDFLHANSTKPDCTGELLHHEYHFADIQVFSTPTTYSAGQIGANPNDLVQMTTFCLNVLSGKQSANNPQKITQGVALVLLAHYIGDLHQPLHVGAEYFDATGNPANPNTTTPFSADKGGNALSLKVLDLSDVGETDFSNLHRYWDDNAVTAAKRQWAAQINPSKPGSVKRAAMVQFLKANLPAGWTSEPVIDPATFAVDCANEILPLAQKAHQLLIFGGISHSAGMACMHVTAGTATALATSDYPTFAGETVAGEIHKAGHRLADVLTVVLK